MRNFLSLSMIIILAGLTWLTWQPPQRASTPAPVQTNLPTDTHKADITKQQKKRQTQQQWRVITHRVISKEGIKALQYRLVSMHLKPISIQSMEDMTMHAFDDATLFKTRKQAHAIALLWQQHDIETNVIKAAEGVYLIGLGRLYQRQYAEDWQEKLNRVGRKYRYQKRIVPIPVTRFTFTPSNRKNSETLWKKLSLTGIMMPLLISETQFQKTYGSNTQTNVQP